MHGLGMHTVPYELKCNVQTIYMYHVINVEITYQTHYIMRMVD